MRFLFLITALLLAASGCSAFPDVVHQPLYHNPFPQLSKVAVLPFYNQSAEPTVNGERVALAYYNELQAVPGFEVVPVGVVRTALSRLAREPRSPEEFQAFARLLEVDAVVVGSITEYDPYYPPRMGLSVRWYAANPGFHPIPPGYGLPWGSAEEEFIPQALVHEAEFALAQEQLRTQTPPFTSQDQTLLFPPQLKPNGDNESELPSPDKTDSTLDPREREARTYDVRRVSQEDSTINEQQPPAADSTESLQPGSPDSLPGEFMGGAGVPPSWPDPRGFIPPAPSMTPPIAVPQRDPIMTHTRIYHGNDAEFTQRLANYVFLRDDARFGDWQAYLQRSDDFIRFCCHLNLTEMLAARGGATETRVVWRWPIGRYVR